MLLFDQMKNGKFADSEKVLRAKIDMAHVNMLMRDPIMYRIRHAHHHRTGDDVLRRRSAWTSDDQKVGGPRERFQVRDEPVRYTSVKDGPLNGP